MISALPIVIGYFVGAIPFGLLLGKLAGIDVRTHGSGNIGATNVLRTCGAKWGVPALLLDMIKGFVPVWFCCSQAETFGIADDSVPLFGALTALACILGHTFPIYLKFKGGKGVATGAGVFLALTPASVGIAFALFVVSVAITRYISVGSTLAALAVTVCHHIFSDAPYGRDLPVTILVWLVFLLVVVRHRTNYSRLLAGTENKFGKSKEKTEVDERPVEEEKSN